MKKTIEDEYLSQIENLIIEEGQVQLINEQSSILRKHAKITPQKAGKTTTDFEKLLNEKQQEQSLRHAILKSTKIKARKVETLGPIFSADKFISESHTTSVSSDTTKPPVIKLSGQLMYPASPWNWGTEAAGAMATNQFYLSDTMPESSVSNTLYKASRSSFSENYETFLDLLPESFPQNLVKKAKLKITEPPGNPADGGTPEGWTIVTIAGLKRWKPIYSVSYSPKQWKLDVQTGRINNPKTIVLDLKDTSKTALSNDDFLLGTSSKLIDVVALKEVSITAKSWGTISIYLGDWFDSGIIDYICNSKKWEDAVDDLKSLLRTRVSAFVVAYEPEINISSSTPFDDQTLEKIKSKATTKDLYSLGVEIESAQISEDKSSVNLKSNSLDPSIVAVQIETFV